MGNPTDTEVPVHPMADALARYVESQIADAIQEWTTETDRSKQAQDIKIGVSDLGFCSERLRRQLAGMTAEQTDMLKAFLGTAIGDYVERAVYERLWPHAIIQSEVVITLVGDQGTYTIPGHPDIVVPPLRNPDGSIMLNDQGLPVLPAMVLDVKTTDGTQVVRREGPDKAKQFQRHGYGLAAWEAGYFGDGVDVTDVWVGNVWIDRSGEEAKPYVHIEPLSIEIVEEAGGWLDNVVYAWLRQEEAAKEPPRQMCEAICGFYRECRAFDTDVQGKIDDPILLGRIEMYTDAHEREVAAKGEKKAVRALLDGIEAGYTDTHSVRWVAINKADGGTTKRLDIRPIPKSKRVIVEQPPADAAPTPE